MSLLPLARHHEYLAFQLEPSRSRMPLPFAKSHRYRPYPFPVDIIQHAVTYIDSAFEELIPIDYF